MQTPYLLTGRVCPGPGTACCPLGSKTLTITALLSRLIHFLFDLGRSPIASQRL